MDRVIRLQRSMGKKIEKIKIIKRKGGTHSPVILSTQESPPESPPEKIETNESNEIDKIDKIDKIDELNEIEKERERLLSLLEDKDDEYLYHFIYHFIENVKGREEEIREKDPQMVVLLDELKEMIKDP